MSAAKQPPVFAGPVPEPKFDLVRITRGETVSPAIENPFAVVGMEQGRPLLLLRRAGRNAGEVVPTRVEEVVIAVRTRRPDDLVDRFDNVGEHRTALLEVPFYALAIGDLKEQNRETVTAERMGAGFVGAILQSGNLDLESGGLPAVDDLAVSIDDLPLEAGNGLRDKPAQRRLGSESSLSREGGIDLEKNEIDGAFLIIADDLADKEALADVLEDIAALDLAKRWTLACYRCRTAHAPLHRAERVPGNGGSGAQ